MNRVTPTTRNAGSTPDLRRRVAELEMERQHLIRQKRRNQLLAGAAISLLAHIGLMWYLGSIIKKAPPGADTQSIFVEFNTITDEQLTELEQAELAVDNPESLTDLSEMPEASPILNLDVTPPAAELEVGDTGSMATLGGASGGGSDLTLGGGSANPSFFGISSNGTRFCYIVDISGSMSSSSKMRTAMRELARSVGSLPDFAYFHVLLFSSSVYEPPFQDGWMRAKEREVSRLSGWLETVSPGGGTQPESAFRTAFGMEEPPDVIFFLTDGQIPQETADEVRSLNRGSRRAVINTIAFGDPRSQDLLKRIATDSGGLYRFVKVAGD